MSATNPSVEFYGFALYVVAVLGTSTLPVLVLVVFFAVWTLNPTLFEPSGDFNILPSPYFTWHHGLDFVYETESGLHWRRLG